MGRIMGRWPWDGAVLAWESEFFPMEKNFESHINLLTMIKKNCKIK
jgi:hypothetical protein